MAAQAKEGVYLEFAGAPGYDLVIKSLEDRRQGIRLLNVRHDSVAGEPRTLATVYVPRAKAGYFLKKVRDYAEAETIGGNPKNRPLVESIDDVSAAFLDSFWTDSEPLPDHSPAWVEAWLRTTDAEAIQAFREIAEGFGIVEHPHHPILQFPERTVLLIRADRGQLESLVEHSDDLAELRAARELASFLINLENREQAEWVNDLLARIEIPGELSTSVCILDAGVNQGHPLIQPVLTEADLHSVEEEWGTHDHHEQGHGTLMAGLAAYGDLQDALQTGNQVQLLHCLESVKILPPPPQENPTHLWGHVTARGISRAEIQAPERRRIVCLAVTAHETHRSGRPTSWSGELDQLAAGTDGGEQRLIVVSAGNVDDLRGGVYPECNRASSVHDPGQAWNAITVGAFTDKARFDDPYLSGYQAMAPAGCISPHTSTSASWEDEWPIKPDVLFEGGNVAVSEDGALVLADDLGVISTWKDPTQGHFGEFHATSAAAAQAAWFAARVAASYPTIWPETVRGLMIHSAEWTAQQRGQFVNGTGKLAHKQLLRCCGYGVPNLRRALYCLRNSVTLVSEATIQPFHRRPDGRYATKEMHLHRLPWPQEVLLELGAVEVRMRVTLSYFIEPAPGEIGWEDRYRYPSHGLRFELNGPGETEEAFLARINRQAREEEATGNDVAVAGPADRWLLGQQRNVGSVHSDTWVGRAADLATSHLIGVRPTVGWWRERPHLGKVESTCRYSLVVSIDSPVAGVDIYTPVAQQIGVEIPVPVSVSVS